MKFEISDLARRAESTVFGDRIEGWEATIKLDGGEILLLSQLDGEAPRWGVDAAFGANGFPHWANGFGSRVVRVRAVGEPIEQALNARRDELAARAQPPADPATEARPDDGKGR
ncbi:hypothetical protein [Nocardia sp. alder85J]|uniref:hypothetical protein n=1 Tax=Nocardia sp. alder85J TaxID=2862949 RepID=UPI001CD7886E|nr:hypothetical protein [Nocardia sp. alder85J]MCX4099119.1 hypothetical protein [Nocardia sp. alder85J]